MSNHGPMNAVIVFIFLVVGLIHLLPVSGVWSNQALQTLYNVAPASADLSLLLRHRAVLFAIVGLMLIVAAFRRDLRLVAGVLGLLSMLSYLALFVLIRPQNAALIRVFWIDVGAAAGLVLALALHAWQAGQSTSLAAH